MTAHPAIFAALHAARRQRAADNAAEADVPCADPDDDTEPEPDTAA